MGRRSKRAERCARCRVHEAHCLCHHIPRIELTTQLALVIHRREANKVTATGPLALAALTNSRLFIHGVPGAPLDLRPLHEHGRRVLLLFPAEGARPLSRSLRDEDPRPITLVVPDGTWGQAARIPKRVPGLQRAERVTLPPGAPSRWGVRHEPNPVGLATFEAIARALGILESPAAQEQLERLFARMVEITHAARAEPAKRRLVETPEPAVNVGPVERDLAILYRDDHLVAINKPAGLPVHRGWAKERRPALQRLRDQLGCFVYPVHRLDRATSGVLLFAFSAEVAREMQQLFEADRIEKHYLALCRGCDANLSRVDHPLAKQRGGEKLPAVTDLQLLGAFERYGLYRVSPHTGRTHQIRRHLKHASHPIIGDTRYGKGEHNRLFRERYQFHRLALHCASMVFDHPRGGGQVALQAPLSEELAALFARLELPLDPNHRPDRVKSAS